jgi:hypothetical protein
LPGHNTYILALLRDVVLWKALAESIATIGDHAGVKIRPASLIFEIGVHAGKRASHPRVLIGGA